MKLAKVATTILVTFSLTAASAVAAFAGPSDSHTAGQPTSKYLELQDANTKASLDYIVNTRVPSAERKTAYGIERDYNFQGIRL